MSVADFEERAFGMHRDEELGSRDQVFVIQIACVDSRRPAADASGAGRRRDSMLQKWLHRDSILAETRNHALQVERDDERMGGGYSSGRIRGRGENPYRVRILGHDLEDADFSASPGSAPVM